MTMALANVDPFFDYGPIDPLTIDPLFICCGYKMMAMHPAHSSHPYRDVHALHFYALMSWLALILVPDPSI